MAVRNFIAKSDMAQVRECLIELQNCERGMDPRMPTGESIVDAYMPEMLRRCRECDGRILVSVVDGSIAGYVTVLARVRNDEPAAGDFEYSLVSDIVVKKKYRKQGLAKELLAAAENYARSCGVRWMRVGALDKNNPARSLYSSSGYAGIYVEYEKNLNG